jgi:hypothetical protein
MANRAGATARSAAIFGDFNTVGLTAAGSTQAAATPCNADHVYVGTATEGQGVILKAGNSLDFRSAANHTTVGIVVYPPVGSQLNGAAANAGLSLPPQTAVLFIFITSTLITAIYS